MIGAIADVSVSTILWLYVVASFAVSAGVIVAMFWDDFK